MGKKKELFLYLVFGGLTTLINIIVYAVLESGLGVDYKLATTVAWVAAVVFAFITNKLFVFQSKDTSARTSTREFILFIFFRILSLGVDLGTMILLIDVLSQDSLLSKIVANVFVVIFNYFASKYLIFAEKQEKEVKA
ncbi:GtrA family protein [Pontibacillus sp. ALD_SL1]|uniref:GtrA family protein n=1 Tax=Pontibacillus sp. ALD_SL1 TaxID=2777185 RepID=UPI001A97A174|nr:GtrA family protein [Pontibacillus sp. ALD_SL1]QSS99695.1 GtrA family protein [Pontibacillus sp. ALD_SL1]